MKRGTYNPISLEHLFIEAEEISEFDFKYATPRRKKLLYIGQLFSDTVLEDFPQFREQIQSCIGSLASKEYRILNHLVLQASLFSNYSML